MTEEEHAPADRPRLLVDTATLSVDADGATGTETGAVWRLQQPGRDLDANVIALRPGGTIERHTGPALDVLLHVLSGAGELITARDTIALTPGALVWLPRRSEREFHAGADGLRYLTVHQRRHDALSIGRPNASTEDRAGQGHDPAEQDEPGRQSLEHREVQTSGPPQPGHVADQPGDQPDDERR